LDVIGLELVIEVGVRQKGGEMEKRILTNPQPPTDRVGTLEVGNSLGENFKNLS